MVSQFVAYYRCSTGHQRKSGLGLEAQCARVREFTSSRGKLIAEFVEVQSGSDNNRPKLREAIACAANEGATIVLASLDRLSRRVSLVSRLMESDVKFISADDPDAPPMVLHLKAVFAEEEARRISTRTKDALAAARARGVRLGNPQGFSHLRGYGNKAAVAAVRASADRHALSTLPRIRAIQQAGETTLAGVAATLNQLAVPTARGGRWHAATVRNVINRATEIIS